MIGRIKIENSFSGLEAAAAAFVGRRACVITDTNVAPLYLETVKTVLKRVCIDVCDIVFPAGEQSKTLSTVEAFFYGFIERDFDRNGVIFALGGGVCGDMAGFAAATYMRGISLVQVPTTLLAQVDSCIGGKTAVNLGNYKNVVGAFYQPQLVYINIGTLKTLPREHFSSGMAEAVKNGLVGDVDYYNWISENRFALKNLNNEALTKLVFGSCRIKSSFVDEDEKETGRRALLNFGHTFAHAIEGLIVLSGLSGFSLPHGHCVALGMRFAL